MLALSLLRYKTYTSETLLIFICVFLQAEHAILDNYTVISAACSGLTEGCLFRSNSGGKMYHYHPHRNKSDGVFINRCKKYLTFNQTLLKFNMM